MALPGIRERAITTPRLTIHVREAGSGNVPVLLIHGNCASSTFFEELMLALPPAYRAIAPDLRGYGATEAKPADATRGVKDWVEDLHALSQALELEQFHLAGWSMGGGIVMQYAIDHPNQVLSLTLIDTVSPFGFGGTKGANGEPAVADFAGAGGGAVNMDYVKALERQDRSSDGALAPRNVLNNFYFKPPFRGAPDQEERWLDGILSTRIGTDFYPGDFTPSANWPTVAPGARGVLNALCGKYFNVAAELVQLSPKPPVLWVRGADDLIVSDGSAWDLAFLGSVGAVPGWPGNEAAPPQPMVTQTRAVLEAYQAAGGRYREVVIEGAAHSPFIEKPAEFQTAFFAHLQNG